MAPPASTSLTRIQFEVQDYDLAATLTSGQAFRWQLCGDCWEGVIGQCWVRLTSTERRVVAEVMEEHSSCVWLADYLQLKVDLSKILDAFPTDEPMRLAVRACRGLRLLRQDPWECLASFILSSNKQIVQIQQIVRSLCEQFGDRVSVPPGHPPVYSFPTAHRLAQCSQGELRACKMGFRAAYLHKAAEMIAAAEVELEAVASLPVAQARDSLLKFPGVGRKIADCVLLFAYGFHRAFPIDVWVTKALRQLYFAGRSVPRSRLESFSQDHFGPFAGYAQQYLFHYMRQRAGRLRLEPVHSERASVRPPGRSIAT
ncbi:MAG: hypothetical protein HY735_20880 [Verrucomicrobia bacterium]|nr:hypothetical protein [Verrucomicrobiota bacterium]